MPYEEVRYPNLYNYSFHSKYLFYVILKQNCIKNYSLNATHVYREITAISEKDGRY